MSRYFLGIDTGATKSHAVIADETGRAIGFARSGPGNHEAIGFDGLRNRLHEIIGAAADSAGIGLDDIAGAGFGLAGYDWPSDIAPTHQVIDSLELRAPYAVVNDATIALIAGAREGWGVAVVAGTGYNARGRDREGREGRVVGEGMMFGEAGGGYELVYQGIRHIALAWTKRGPETLLSELYLQHFGAATVPDLLEGLCRHRYKLRPQMAPLIFQAADAGDEVARDIIRWDGAELGGLAHGIIRQLHFEDLAFDVVMAGSIFKGGPLLIEVFRETVLALAPAARFVHLTAPPVVGGVLLGMEQVALRSPAVRDRLLETVAAKAETPL